MSSCNVVCSAGPQLQGCPPKRNIHNDIHGPSGGFDRSANVVLHDVKVSLYFCRCKSTSNYKLLIYIERVIYHLLSKPGSLWEENNKFTLIYKGLNPRPDLQKLRPISLIQGTLNLPFNGSSFLSFFLSFSFFLPSFLSITFQNLFYNKVLKIYQGQIFNIYPMNIS